MDTNDTEYGKRWRRPLCGSRARENITRIDKENIT